MATKRRSEAIWIDSKSYWMIKVQKDGERKSFYSSISGRKGKHEAEAKADAWLESNSDSDIGIISAWAQFLEEQKARTSTSNYNTHEMFGRLYILPVLGHQKLSGITPRIWQKCIDAGANAGLSRRSCVNIKASITSFITFCRKARWDVERLEKGDLIIPNSAAASAEKRVLQPHDIRILFSHDTITDKRCGEKLAHYIYAWRFLVVTGLRRGELCGLQNEDIDGSVLHVRRSINKLQETTAGKNDNARRTIVLTPTALNILAEQRNMLKRKSVVSMWVFPNGEGECTNPNYMYKAWKRYCAEYGLSASIHELRHTFISISKNDLPLELLKSVVGHSSAMDTMGVYGHEIDGEAERAAKIIEGVFEKTLRQSD